MTNKFLQASIKHRLIQNGSQWVQNVLQVLERCVCLIHLVFKIVFEKEIFLFQHATQVDNKTKNQRTGEKSRRSGHYIIATLLLIPIAVFVIWYKGIQTKFEKSSKMGI